MLLTVFAIAAIVACAICARYFLAACAVKNYKGAFWLKGGASLCFVITGLVFMGKCSDAGFALLIVLGLVGGILGDQLLALRFVYKEKHDLYFMLGMLAFAAGHVMYIVALFRHGVQLKPAIIFTVLGLVASAAWLLVSKAQVPRPMLIGGGLYFVLLIFMAGCTLGCALIDPCLGTWMLFAGGVCFAISDNILSAYSFGNDKKFGMNIALHVFYYAAQMLIALSLWVL